MVRTQIQLTESQSATLKRLSEQKKKSVAQLIRDSIDLMMRSEGLEDLEARKKRAIAACGQFRSGAKDLADRHDDYLAEIYGEVK